MTTASPVGVIGLGATGLGLREGVDAAALHEVITHRAGNSWMFENRMAHVLACDYTPLSTVDSAVIKIFPGITVPAPDKTPPENP